MPNRIGAEGPYSLIPRTVLRPAEGQRINIEDFWECLKSPLNIDSRRRRGVSAKAVAAYYGRRSGRTFYSPKTGKSKSGPRLGSVGPRIAITPPADPIAAAMVEAFGVPTGDANA
jgi:hypothetical protein